MTDDSRPSASDYLALESNQTRHYRPVHRDNKDWSIHELGSQLKLRAGSENYKISKRDSISAPIILPGATFLDTIIQIVPTYSRPSLIIRKSGQIIGYARPIEDHIIKVYTNDTHTILDCTKPHEAVLITPDQKIHYSYDESTAFSNHVKVRKLEGRRRFSIFTQTTPHEEQTCQGFELEVPFNALGALIFDDNEIPAQTRLALSWFASQKGVCED